MKDLRPAKEYGSRYATRVRINAAHGSSWNGRTGTLARIEHDTPFIRFGANSPAIPFGFADLEVIS